MTAVFDDARMRAVAKQRCRVVYTNEQGRTQLVTLVRWKGRRNDARIEFANQQRRSVPLHAVSIPLLKETAS